MANSKDTQSAEPKRLYRSKIDRIFAGVCGGFAEYFNIDPVIVRILFLILIFVNGWGFWIYLVSLIVMRENPHQSAADRKPQENTSLYWGAGLIILGLVLLAHRWELSIFPFEWFRFWPFDWDVIWPLTIILLGVLYLIYVLRQDSEEKTDETQSERLYRSRTEKVVGGVCGGLAEKLNIDPVLIRIGWVIFTLATNFFIGAVIYLVWMIAIPEAPPAPISEQPKPEPPKKPKARRVKKVPAKKKSGESPDSKTKEQEEE